MAVKVKLTEFEKTKIEDKYHKVIISCACGATYESGSTLEGDTVRVDICSSCHPFFTGDKRILDSEGRIDKFKKKYNLK